MASIGDTSISGAFGLSDTTGIAAYVDSQVTNHLSGATIFTYQDQENRGVWVGVTLLK